MGSRVAASQASFEVSHSAEVENERGNGRLKRMGSSVHAKVTNVGKGLKKFFTSRTFHKALAITAIALAVLVAIAGFAALCVYAPIAAGIIGAALVVAGICSIVKAVK